MNSSSSKNFLALAILLLVSFAAYEPTLSGRFVYDEIGAITQNPMLFKASPAHVLFTKDYFSLSQEATYRPVVTASYLFDYALWQLRPFGWRLANLLLHLLCVGLLFAWLRLLRIGPLPAWIGAAAFALHPLHVEVVVCVGFREDLFAAAGLLAMAVAYRLWRGRQLGLMAAAVLAGAATLFAQLSKENAFMAPLLLLALAACDAGPDGLPLARRLVRARTLIATLAGATLAIFLIRFLLMRNTQIPAVPYGARLMESWLRAPWIFLFHEVLPVFIPYHLRPDRIINMAAIGPLAIALGWALLLALIWLILPVLRKADHRALGLLWYALLWIPTSNIVPLFTPAAERYAYAPDLGLALLLAALLQPYLIFAEEPAEVEDTAEEGEKGETTGESAALEQAARRQDLRNVLLGGAALLLLGCGFLTYRQVQLWSDIETLWHYELSVEPHSIRARHSLAFSAWAQSEMAQAVGNPNAANVYLRQALDLSRQAVDLAPGDKDSLTNYGIFLMRAGEYEEAQQAFASILSILPNDRLANHAMGEIYLENPPSNPDKALPYFRKAQDNGYPEDPQFMEALEKKVREGSR